MSTREIATLPKEVDVLVVGAGHAGLAARTGTSPAETSSSREGLGRPAEAASPV